MYGFALCSACVQGSFQLYVEVFDDDPNVPLFEDSHVDDIYVDSTLSTSPSFTAEQWYTGDHDSRILLSFRVQCNANFYGSECAVYCVAQDDNGGHFTCSSSGEKLCLSGWSDPSGNCLTRKELIMRTGSCLPIACSMRWFPSGTLPRAQQAWGRGHCEHYSHRVFTCFLFLFFSE